jgi:nicotinate-nucleotide adenylyltransferase
MDLSSGIVRDRIRRGENWRYLIPQGARIIIEDRRLYGYTPPAGGAGKITGECITDLEITVRTMISPARFLHSRNVALLSEELCRRFGLDPPSGYLAGITHDMCKEFNEEKMIALAEKDGFPFSKEEREKPSLLHGRAAAVLLREKFSITDESVIDAVRYHTTGKAGMSALGKIVYLTDKIEVARTTVAPELRRAAFTKEGESLELDALFNTVFKATVAWLFERGLKVSDDSLRLLETIGDTE